MWFLIITLDTNGRSAMWDDMNMRVGFTCSTFDLFHAGHVLMLEEAKRQCDWLIVGLQTDPTIDRPAKNKPVQSVFERFVQVSACKWVNEVVVYESEKDLMNLLKSYNIHVRILGKEYQDKDFTGRHLGNIELYFNSRDHSFSTTELRNRIREAEEQKLKY